LTRGLDAPGIEPGSRYCVPIVPTADLYAEVSIAVDAIAGVAYNFALVITDAFSMEEELISLGLWTAGEGRLVMASSINDWMGVLPDVVTCNAGTHGFKEEMELQKDPSPVAVKATRWCLAYHKCCFPCYKVRQNTVLGTGRTIQDFTASSFGIQAGDFNITGAAPSNGRQAFARDALRAKYSKRQLLGIDPMPQGNNNWLGFEF
jgi:hypothetical protein